MKAFIKKTIKKFGAILFEDGLHELKDAVHQEMGPHSQATQILLAQSYKNLAASHNRPLPTFDDVGFRCYSQFEEDGILLYLFAMIGTTNKIAMEICAGDGIECNTANLIINHGWKGFLFDGCEERVDAGRKYYAAHKNTFLCPPTFTRAWITAESVNDVIAKAGVKGEIDLLSLDIDGVDYWVWKAMDHIQPRVVICETHNVIGPDDALTVPYNPDFVMKTPDYHSASLAAMSKLASAKGYRLIGTHRYGFNAFFLRNDIAPDLFPAVSVASCLQHPYAKQARETRWPKVKDLDWVKV